VEVARLSNAEGRALTIARWQDGKIVEEHLKYDNRLFLQQIGLA
jgi:hypothetical protein